MFVLHTHIVQFTKQTCGVYMLFAFNGENSSCSYLSQSSFTGYLAVSSAHLLHTDISQAIVLFSSVYLRWALVPATCLHSPPVWWWVSRRYILSWAFELQSSEPNACWSPAVDYVIDAWWFNTSKLELFAFLKYAWAPGVPFRNDLAACTRNLEVTIPSFSVLSLHINLPPGSISSGSSLSHTPSSSSPRPGP